MMILSYMAMGACALLLIVACSQWALRPQSAVGLPSTLAMPRGQLSGLRRHPLSGLLELVGAVIAWRRQPAGPREQELYAGSGISDRAFRGVRLLTAAGAVIMTVILLHEFGSVEPVWVVSVGAVGFILPVFWLKARLAKRKHAIVRALPEMIDLLTLCVGAGLDFLSALQKVVVVRGSRKDDPLIQELRIAMNEIKLGQRKVDALKAMAKRANVPELASFVRTLVQGERMGTPLSEVLSIHAEDLRFIRYAIAERAALKAPIKILIPLIFCIMPCVALIVGGPVFIQFMKQNPFGR